MKHLKFFMFAMLVSACGVDGSSATKLKLQDFGDPVCWDVFGDPIYDFGDSGFALESDCYTYEDPTGGGGDGGGGWCWPTTTISRNRCSTGASAETGAQASAGAAAELACIQSASACIASPGPATYSTNCGTTTTGEPTCCATASVSCSYSFTW